MIEPVYELAPQFGIGAGTFIDGRHGVLVHHTGGAPGATAIVGADTETGRGLVILTNCDDRIPRRLHERLTTLLTETLVGPR